MELIYTLNHKREEGFKMAYGETPSELLRVVEELIENEGEDNITFYHPIEYIEIKKNIANLID